MASHITAEGRRRRAARAGSVTRSPAKIKRGDNAEREREGEKRRDGAKKRNREREGEKKRDREREGLVR